MTTPSFTSGMQAMQDAIDEGKRRADAAKSGGGGSSLHYFNWKPGDKKILRFLSDDPIIENFAEFIVDKNGETKNFMIPATNPGILDRYRQPIGSPGYPIGWRKNPKNGKIEDPKLRKVGVGIAVLRDEQPGPDGQMVVQDYLYDQTIKVNEVESVHLSRYYGIVQQSVSNFWHTLAVSCYKRFGSICDRDYIIERTGEGLDTKYSIIPLSAGPPNDPDLATLEAVQSFYFYGYKWDNEDPKRFVKCPQTLQEWAAYFASEDRFKFWLTGEGSVTQAATPTPSYSPPPQQSGTNPWGGHTGDPEDPMGEFHPATTHNTPEVARQTTGTSFSSFKDELIKTAKEQEK